jgi:hypothetical protein
VAKYFPPRSHRGLLKVHKRDTQKFYPPASNFHFSSHSHSHSTNSPCLKAWLVMRSFEKGDLSLGQLADSLGKTKADTLQFLAQFNIPLADYDVQEDLATVEKLLAFDFRLGDTGRL